MTEERTFTAAEIIDAMNRSWNRSQELFDDDDITPEEKAGRDAGIINVAKELGLISSFIVSPTEKQADNASPIAAGE